MKIATFNVNSIRKRLPIVVDWLKRHQPDVMCLQETKVEDKNFPAEPFKALGYHVFFRGMKTFNGVATLAREIPEDISYGLEPGADSEDFRVLTIRLRRGLPIVNTYVPNGTLVGSVNFAKKLQWFKRLEAYFKKKFSPKKPLLWLGDMNIAPEPIDVYSPQAFLQDPCFHPDARKAYEKTIKWGFLDVFRLRYPKRIQYTYWDFFRRHFERDRGWRLDHILATRDLANRCTAVAVDLEPRKAAMPSDHTVVYAEFSI